MKKQVRYSTQAKKDLKRYKHDMPKLQELYKVLQVLSSGEQLDKRYRPHMLSGEYKDCMECHVGNDFLLIWMDSDAIYVERVGTHSELFKSK